MNFKKAHFIGIAGKGMSATALLLKEMGVEISGSDEGFYPPVSDYLQSANVAFAQGYRKENIPNDVDVILVMQDDFRLATCLAESLVLFDHSRADAELGASVFWVRPGMLFGEPLEQFLAHWERKRDGSRRGIVEIRP